MTALLAPSTNGALLALEGRFDAYEAPRFRQLSGRLRSVRDPIVTLDLRRVRYLDMSAVRELRRLERDIAADGRQLCLLVSDVVRVILELTGARPQPAR